MRKTYEAGIVAGFISWLLLIITESLGLEGTSGGLSSNLLLRAGGKHQVQTRVLRVSPSWVLKTSRDGDAMASLDRLFQCLIILTEEKESFPCLLTENPLFQSVSYCCAVYLSKEPGSIFFATSSLGAGGLLLHWDISILALDKMREIHLTAPKSALDAGEQWEEQSCLKDGLVDPK